MKNTFKLFVTLFILSFAINGIAQIPRYCLIIKNGQQVTADRVTFDIVIVHTDATPMEYASGQYFFKIPLSGYGTFVPGTGANSPYQYDSAGGQPISELPQPFWPRNPSAAISGSFLELRLAPNSVPIAGNGLIMAQGDSLLVMRMKLTSTTPMVPILGVLQIRDSCSEQPISATRTKINAYIGTTNTEITNCACHVVEDETVLPVELANFAASVNRNNVNLNWATATENNNQGFDIERKLLSATDWTRVGNVAGSGTTTEQRKYTFSDRTSTGKYNYRLKQIDLNGNFAYHDLTGEVIVGVPSNYNLSQNYPNPFNPSTKVDYDLPYDGQVSIKLFDISGREVSTLVNEVKTAGYYTLGFNGASLSSGIYFYTISAEANGQNFVTTKKMMLIK
ncbi:MAG: T9SS type A sorting domain-containing protein [Bacteroidota bacterium]|nr:T9SS type A sorting domain-containing protein [Bacteroidota bacterium]